MFTLHHTRTAATSINTRILIGVVLLLAAFECVSRFSLGIIDANSIPSYIALHNVLEFVAALVSSMICIVGWNRHNNHANARIMFVAVSFMLVSVFDLGHALSFRGMPEFVTTNDDQKSITFWIAARYVAALSLLVAGTVNWSPLTKPAVNRWTYLITAALIGAVVTWLAIWEHDALPLWYDRTTGLTSAKIWCEYGVIAISALTAGIMLWKSKLSPTNKEALFISAVVVMGLGELYFTWYTGLDGVFNVLGHLYKVIAYWMLFRAIVVDVIETPFDELADVVNYDALTGLANRTYFSNRVAETIERSAATNAKMAIMFLDVDNFKNINDSLGHVLGDQVLIEIGNRLSNSVRQTDLVARMGGDEFMVMLPGVTAKAAETVATNMLASISAPFCIDNNEIIVTPSIGIAIYDNDGRDFATLYRHADTAMYRAKQDGRNTFRFFNQAMQDTAMRSLQLEHELRTAIQHEQLTLQYQPQIDLRTNTLVGAEALLRWNHPVLGNVPPSEFIPVAESTGLIVPIGDWVFRTAAQQMKQWVEAGLTIKTVAINFSAIQLRQPGAAKTLLDILSELELASHHLEMEITESVAMDSKFQYFELLNSLRTRGIKLSIDDFGTGYSSLSQLRMFNCNALKIDQQFVRNLTNDNKDTAIVKAIIDMAHVMGFVTIAEGVETLDQLQVLRSLGCDIVQGYLYSRPVSATQFEEFATACKKCSKQCDECPMIK
jgi:diguanylate cyclase (GGDEF)-like protein